MSAFWSDFVHSVILLLTPCNVISLTCNNTDVVYNYGLLASYVQVCIQCARIYSVL